MARTAATFRWFGYLARRSRSTLLSLSPGSNCCQPPSDCSVGGIYSGAGGLGAARIRPPATSNLSSGSPDTRRISPSFGVPGKQTPSSRPTRGSRAATGWPCCTRMSDHAHRRDHRRAAWGAGAGCRIALKPAGAISLHTARQLMRSPDDCRQRWDCERLGEHGSSRGGP